MRDYEEGSTVGVPLAAKLDVSGATSAGCTPIVAPSRSGARGSVSPRREFEGVGGGRCAGIRVSSATGQAVWTALVGVFEFVLQQHFSLQVFIRQSGHLQQVPEQTGLERLAAVNGHGKPDRASRLAVDVWLPWTRNSTQSCRSNQRARSLPDICFIWRVPPRGPCRSPLTVLPRRPGTPGWLLRGSASALPESHLGWHNRG